MKHFGDITKINGYDAPPVDVIVGGSPCQDLSIAGKRAGLDGERSGLFMEQLRIIKEMRENDRRNGRSAHDVRPRYMVWENVPGAFSSHGGEDFRIVLEETAKAAEKDASIPMPDKGKWANAGCVMGNGWSIAWRVLDAQFWGVPQRRRRIALVADFGGQSASEILFVRKSVSGHSEPSEPQRKETSCDASRGFGADDREGKSYGFPLGFRPENVRVYEETGTTLCNGTRPGFTTGVIQPVYSIENHPADSRVDIDESGKVQTLTGRMGTVGGNVPMVMECYSKSKRAQSATDFETWKESDTANTLNAFDIGDVRTTEIVCECYAGDQGGGKSSCKVFEDQAPTLTATHDGSPVVAYQDSVIALDRASYNQGKNAQFDIGIDKQGCEQSLVARGPGAVAYCIGNGQVHDAMTPSKEICKTLNCMDDPIKVLYQDSVGALCARDYKGVGSQYVDEDKLVVCAVDAAYWDGGQTVGTLTANNASGNQRMPDKENFNCIIEKEIASVDARNGTESETNGALQSNSAHSLNGNNVVRVRYIVRRLTPMECERLQGYPDGWTDIGEYTDTNGKKRKSSDAARYKALGNSIALPPWKWVMKRISACYERDATLASLFDGIGGFPYIWEQINGKGSCLWASEIEEFCIAVTKRRIG